MKRVTGLILVISLLLNAGTAAFCSALPGACARPAVSHGKYQLAKLLSSVRGPFQAMNAQVESDNPLVPNMFASSRPDDGSGTGRALKNLITATDNRSAKNIRMDSGNTERNSALGYSPASFDEPRVFPPPGLETCVNYLYLQYFVFLAKANLPWEIVFSYA